MLPWSDYTVCNAARMRAARARGDVAALFFDRALTPDGWRRDVRVAIDGGAIRSVSPNSAPEAGDERHAIGLPGMPNLHSHAFQRGMAGLAEIRGPRPTPSGPGGR